MRTTYIFCLSLVSIAFLNTACNSHEKQEAFLVGTWEAEWRNNGGNAANDVMLGKIAFKKDHNAAVEVYGYKDCVFFSDTVKQQLQWQLIGEDTVQLLNPASSFDIAYAIKDFSEAALQLSFMEDITIKLRKL